MRQLEPVVWTKGALLSPQHLQVQDRFLEDTLRFQLEALSFSPWGFRRLRLDQEALAAGLMVVSEASGCFPDGLLFYIPGSDAAPDSCPLAEVFDQDRDSLEVFLAVPHYKSMGVNVAVSPRHEGARYRAEVTMLRDENTGASEKPVQVARKNLRLMVEGEPLEGHSSLRVARVLRSPSGLYDLDPRHVPPLLAFGAGDPLLSIARRLVETLAARSTALASLRSQKNQNLAGFTASDIANFWLLYTINSYFPLFRHLFELQTAHPEELYSAMLALAGSLTTFSATVHPRDLPAYDHNRLGECFATLNDIVLGLLATVVPSNFVAIPLEQVQNSIHAAALAEDRFFGDARLYLAVSADMSQAELIGRVPELVKIGSISSVEHLVRRALPGVPLRHVSTPPGGVPVKLAYEYFSLGQSGEAWESIVRARNLAAYVPGDIVNPRMELIVLLPSAR